MRIASWLLLLLTLSSIDGCQTPGPPSTARVGLSGGPLARELTVIVLDEATGAELAGATVTSN